MIDFTPIRNKEVTWPNFVKDYSKKDLTIWTNELTDTMLEIIKACDDSHITFQPIDPDAHDPYAEGQGNSEMAWNLGHIIVHSTASSEESAFLAAELARGVEMDARRSRSEVPWENMTSIDQARERLKESRRMILGSLDMWPEEANLENYYETRGGLKVSPLVRFLFGMSHAESHLDQIQEIIRQANA